MDGTATTLRPINSPIHRVSADAPDAVCNGTVKFSAGKSLWFYSMLAGTAIGAPLTISWGAVTLFLATTTIVLLLGHSLGSHRKLIHNSFQCPRWLEYFLVYCGVQVGLAGPIGLLRQHELRDYAQRLPSCHNFLRHGESFWRDAWWQLSCDLHLKNPPRIDIEARIADNPFFRWLERTWPLQHAVVALAFFLLGGWAYVFWGVCARITVCILGHWLIGYFAHNHGNMTYRVRGAAVQGRNIRLTSLLTMGECWHNNHHAYPGSARLGLQPGEWDPGWWTLQLLHKAGLAWGFVLPSDLPHRQELEKLPLPIRATQPATYTHQTSTP
jgi:fatty-acid desaturase